MSGPDMAALIAHRFDAMTLGEATRLLRAEPWACACIGDPYCCRHGFDHARRLQRAAHIVARQLADDVARARRYMFPPDIRAALSCTCTFNMSTGKWEPPPGGCPAGHSGPW